MASEIALRTAASLPQKLDYAQQLSGSLMLPAQYRKQPSNVLWAIEYGETLGITPMAAITGVHVIEGKPSASAALISGLVRRAGHKLRVRGDAKSATAQIIRCDDPDYVFEVTFTIEDARTAGVANKAVWKNYPASMLKARAITQVARDACEEILFGLHYTPEELGAEVDAEGEPVYLVDNVNEARGLTPADAADAVVRKAQREMVDIAPREHKGQTNPFDPDFDLPPTLGSASTMPANNGQLQKIAILFQEKRNIEAAARGEVARMLRLEGISKMIGREISSSKELTLREAQEVIEALKLEPNHIADAEVVEDAEPPSEDEQLHADLAAAVDEAETDPELDAVLSSVAGAMDAGQLSQEQGMRLRDVADRKRQGWSHRLLEQQTGVAA